MESGAQVARTLGELTNVTIIFDAAREAVRRKLETARDLKKAEKALAEITEQARGFAGIRERRAALQEAQGHLEDLRAAEQRVTRLSELAHVHERAKAAREVAEAVLEAATPPGTERLDELLAQRARLMELDGQWHSARADAESAQQRAVRCGAVQADVGQELTELLVQAGVCPTCGKATV
jgi:hypothetical protein